MKIKNRELLAFLNNFPTEEEIEFGDSLNVTSVKIGGCFFYTDDDALPEIIKPPTEEELMGQKGWKVSHKRGYGHMDYFKWLPTSEGEQLFKIEYSLNGHPTITRQVIIPTDSYEPLVIAAQLENMYG